MKTILPLTKLLALAMLLVASTGLFAQDAPKAEKQKFHLRVVKDENGNKEVIDRTFNSKEEMDAFVKENKIEAPDGKTLTIDENGMKQCDKKCDKKEKKIIIIEKEEGSNGQGSFQIDASQLTGDERIKLMQQLIDMKLAKVEVQHQQVKTNGNKEESLNNAAEPPHSTNAEGVENVEGLKIFPNPSAEGFHVEFNVPKPTDVKLRITDIDGKEVYAYAANNFTGKFEKDINRSGIASGTYVMTVQAGTQNTTTRVVMQ